jgi:predicted small lipoprotein YifL
MFASNRRRLAGPVALAMIALLAACGNSTGPLAPFQPQISNAADNFQFQATGVTNVTWTYAYSWSNSGDSATVNHSTTTTGGSAVLTIYDKNNTQVYSAPLAPSGTVGVTKGVAGVWTIKVVFTNYSGTVNFRVQKAP